MRIIFDRSSFHGDRFDVLASSPLRELVKRGALTVVHTPVFLEETIQAVASARAAQEGRAHLAFAVDICNGGLFLTKTEIWRNELVCGQGPNARHLIPDASSRRHRSLAQNLQLFREIAATGVIPKAEWDASRADREDAQVKRNNQKELFSNARKLIVEARRAGTLRGNLKDFPFAAFRSSDHIKVGRSLMNLVEPDKAAALADQWERTPVRFPFYSAFVEGFLYSEYYAAIEHNRPLDRNAQADYEHLSYLLWADAVVSNDEGFFRSAFEEIWAPRGKLLFSAEKFAAYAHKF